MTIATRIVVLAVLLCASSAAAEDAYYNVPLGELKITDGELPQPSSRPPGARPAMGPLPWTWRPDWSYATVEGGGEAYVWAPGWSGPAGFLPPGTPGSADPRCLAIRAPKGRDVAGRLFLTNPDGVGMAAIGFAVPSERASEAARTPFFQAKSTYYIGLQSMGSPGGAWFRHQARQAQKEGDLPPEQDPGMGPFATQFQRFPRRPTDLASTYALFSGGRAVSENLQLDRVLAETRGSSPLIPVDSIPGVTTREIDWRPLIEGLEPDQDPLAALVPADQYLLVFPNVEAAATIGDLMSEGGTIFLRLAEPRVEDSRIIAKYEGQLGLSIRDAARMLKSLPIRSLAVTGSDLYFAQGTDLAILLETAEPERLAALLVAQIGLSTVGDASAEWSVGEMGGLAYRGVSDADRRRSSYVARLPGAVVVTNSLYQLRRLASVQEDKSESIAALPEYKFFRARYVRGDEGETAFGLLSDAAIRRLCGPRWRIGASRRTRDAAVMAAQQADHLDELVTGNVAPRSLSAGTRLATPSRLSLTASGVLSSNAGTLDFMTPISELPLDRVTQEEARAYEQWRQGYERNWTWAFDPMALRLSVRENRVSADLTVMPLIVATQYRPMVSITQGAELAPDAGDRHGALAHAVLAINTDSELFGMGRRFASRTPLGPAVDPFGWIGQSVAIYADDDPFWKELAEVPEAERLAFLEKEGWRLPVGLQVEVSSGLKLVAFLTAIRTLVDQAAPGMTEWETLTYHDEPYTKVSLTERGRRGQRGLDQAALYYAASGDALVVSTSEDVLKRAIDRQLQRQKTDEKDRSAIATGRSWLGKSVGVEIDAKLVEALVRFSRNEYQAMMQARSWANLPILNEWKRRYPNEDPIALHERFWQTRLVCPGGGEYVWNDRWHSFESTVYGHPGQPKPGPAVPPALSAFARGNFGLTFEHQGLRAQVSLDRAAEAGPAALVVSEPGAEEAPAWTRLGEENAEIAKALAALQADPTDPQANLAVGKFLSIEKADWERGVPLLVLGSDAELKSAAEREWAGAATPEELLRLGTAWWNLAQTRTGREKQACLLRAGAWYQVAGKAFSTTSPEGKEPAARLATIGEIGGTIPALPARRSLPAMAMRQPPPPLRQDAAPDDVSSRNFRQIGLALHNHHDVHKTFPPAYRSGRDGKPLLSWRVLILPHLEQQPLFDQFRLDEPWDSEHNKRLIPQMPAVFRSPLSRAGPGKTNYLGVGGQRGIFPGKETINLARIQDGTSNTIAVVEVDDTAAIEWTRPGDFEPNPAEMARVLGGLRNGRFLALFADGSVSLVSGRADPAVLNGLFTRDGGEPFGFPAWSSAVAPEGVAAELAEEDVEEVEQPAGMAVEATEVVEEPQARAAPPRAQLATESPFAPQEPARQSPLEAAAGEAGPELQAALATLREKPEDPQANLLVGRYLCFVKGAWDQGIPLVALGSDEGLKAIAQRELEGTDGYHEQVEIGDGWWELADAHEGQEKEAMLLRAGSWYREARKAQLTSVLLKAKLDKRLGEITKLGRGIPLLRVARPVAPTAPSTPVRPASPPAQPSSQEEYQQAVAGIEKLGGRLLAKGYKPSWAPDGTKIAFSHRRIEDGVGVVDLSTGTITTVVAPGKDSAWSPDGKFIAYVAIPNRRDEEVWLVESTGANPRRLAEGGFPTWSSDGKMLFYHSRKEGRLKMIETPESEPVVRDGIRLPFYYPAIAPDDQRLVYRVGNELRLVSLQTGEPVRRWPLPPSAGLIANFSPDGKQLGFGGWGGHDRLDLSIIDLQTGRTRQLLSRQFTFPLWSPDGSKLTVDLRARGTLWDIWLLDAKALETTEARPRGVEPD